MSLITALLLQRLSYSLLQRCLYSRFFSKCWIVTQPALLVSAIRIIFFFFLRLSSCGYLPFVGVRFVFFFQHLQLLAEAKLSRIPEPEEFLSIYLVLQFCCR